MWLSESLIKPSGIPLVGFEGSRIKPLGAITLKVAAANRILDVEFLVIDAGSGYNAIMGRGWIHRMEGVPSTLHQVMRCLSEDGTKTVDIRGSQIMADTCYSIATGNMTGKGKEKVED